MLLFIYFNLLLAMNLAQAQDRCRDNTNLTSLLSAQAQQGLVSSMARAFSFCPVSSAQEDAREYQRLLTLQYSSMIQEVNALFSYFATSHVVDEATVNNENFILELMGKIAALIPGVSTGWSMLELGALAIPDELKGQGSRGNPIHKLEKLRLLVVDRLEEEQRQLQTNEFEEKLECAFATEVSDGCSADKIRKLSCLNLRELKNAELQGKSKAKFHAAFARLVANNVFVNGDSTHFEVELDLSDDQRRVRGERSFEGFAASAILCKLAKDPAIARLYPEDVPLSLLGVHADITWDFDGYQYHQVLDKRGRQKGEVKRINIKRYDENYVWGDIRSAQEMQEIVNRKKPSTHNIPLWSMVEHCQ